MSGRYALFALCLIACGRVGFDPSRDGDIGGSGDGGTIGEAGTNGDAGANGDGGTSACVAAVPATTFPGGFPCANWSANTQQTNGGLSESSGTLTLTPNANSVGASVGCQRDNVTITAAGVFTEVSQVLVGTSSTTRFEAVWGGETYYIGTQNNGMRAGAVNVGVTFSGGNVARWWRIRPAGGLLHFEYGDDGRTWNDFAQIGGIPTGVARLRVVAATPSAEAAPGAAKFESVNVCPP